MSLTILICAAGSQARWEKSGGQGLKQLIEIDGETLIFRLYRQVADRGFADVVTLVSDPDLECWQGANPRKPAHEDWMGEMGKFLDGRPYWPEEGEVCILYGDAYYTEATLDRILDHEPDQPTVYGRANAPGRQRESFGFRFRIPEDVEEVDRICRVLARAGKNTKGGPWRWFFYRHTGRKGIRKGVDSARLSALATEENGWVECGHDATDDFDKVGDFHAWTSNESRRAARLPSSDEGTSMKVKLTTSFAGPRAAYSPGDTINVNSAQAHALLSAGHAVPVAETSVKRGESRSGPARSPMKRPELMKRAKALGIPARGSNAALTAAIEAAEQGDA